MSVYQIELTNLCNAACPWCGNRSMQRERGFMGWDTLQRAVGLIKREPPPAGVVGLHHFGESLLHPRIGDILAYLRREGIAWRLSTNGRLLRQPEVRDLLLEFAGLLVISMENGADLDSVNALIEAKGQRQPRLKILVQTFGEADLGGLAAGDYEIFRTAKHSWAASGGGDHAHCCFLVGDWVCVLWDGAIVSCCMDLEGEAKLGHVKSGRVRNRPWRACRTCEVVMRCS